MKAKGHNKMNMKNVTETRIKQKGTKFLHF